MTRVFDRYESGMATATQPLQITYCVWLLCEAKTREMSGNPDGADDVTPWDILAWVGLWALETEVRARRPFDDCNCCHCCQARAEKRVSR